MSLYVVGLRLGREILTNGTGRFVDDGEFRLFWWVLGGRGDVLRDRRGRVVGERDLGRWFYRVCI